jgi:transposase
VIPQREDERRARKSRGRRGGRPPLFDREVYQQRNRVERAINRLKQSRRVATRYEKRAANYLAFVEIAGIMMWLGR